MATRKIVPRGDNEGGLGTTLKRWASAFIAAITCTTINALTLAAASVGFTIAGGTILKTLTVLDNVSVGGLAVNPTLPAFLAKPTSSQDNIAVSSSVTVVWGTEIFDQGGNFASNTFTAPVTGKYQLSTLVYLSNLDTASGYYVISIVTSNRSYQNIFSSNAFAADVPYYTFALSILADMDVGDTATIEVFQETGTQQTDIAINSWFSGFLVC